MRPLIAARKNKSPRNFAEKSATPKAKRLNQLLASAGYGSRRHVEELIREGRVTIDGEVVQKLGVSVDPKHQTVRVDDNILRQQRLVYYAVHKPTGVVTTNADPQGRPRVIDLVPPSERVFPVGRLDRSSEGLILLTNDGELAQKLAHPRYAIEKVYRVTVAGKVDGQALQKMRKGIYIAEGHVRVDGARVLKARPKATEMEIRLREGKNREIRRILAKLGHKVQSLRRIAIGPLRLGDMPTAAYRKLTPDEVRRLHEATRRSTASVDEVGDEPKPPKRKSRGGKRPSRNSTAARQPGGSSSAPSARNRRKKTERPGKARSNYSASRSATTTGTVIGADASADETPGQRKRPASRGKRSPSNRRRSASKRSQRPNSRGDR